MANERSYEVMFIVDPTTGDEDVTRLSENLQSIVTEQGGQIVKAENMGRRALAYEINRQNEGIYVLFEISGSGKEIAELERRMRVNDQIVRYLTVRVDEDRRRAEKLRTRRAERASKRPFAAKAGARSGVGVAVGGAQIDDDVDVDEDASMEEMENA